MSHEVASRPVHGGLSTYLTLSSSSNHVICIIINYSLHGYIMIMPAPLRNILLFFVSLFILEVGPSVCPLSSKYHVYHYHKLWFSMQACNLVHIHARIFTNMPSFGKI